jgi:predicted porin
MLSYNFTHSTGDSIAKYHQFGGVLDYFLSKRTDLYLLSVYQRATGQNGLGAAQASIGSYEYVGKGSQAVVAVGMRQKF